MVRSIHIFGGGTFSHVRAHLALAAPAFGGTARFLKEEIGRQSDLPQRHVCLELTRMAGGEMVTNSDVFERVNEIVADPDAGIIVMSAALCDFAGEVGDVTAGSRQTRLKTSDGDTVMNISPLAKLLPLIRQKRKNIFVVGFKTTTGATPDEQYVAGLTLLKNSSVNLVLANDLTTRLNMVITPEESRYYQSTDREVALAGLTKIMLSRSKGTFTRSKMMPGDAVPWSSDMIPENLRQVVDYCRDKGAYKPFLGKTVGHFAVKLGSHQLLTSKRKHDFNDLPNHGLVRVEYGDGNSVMAFGAKPSVGGMSQKAVFDTHPELDCIVHAHVPLRPDHPDAINTVPQWRHECGSHECGVNTALGLQHVRDGVHVVMLDNHGPNIVFSRNVPAEVVIDVIEKNFDLSAKTGGLLTKSLVDV